jgi:hypothetical protein
MECRDSLPAVVSQAQHDLTPYIRSRQETARIRQVLAVHLQAQLEPRVGCSNLALLSLPDSSTGVKSTSKNIQGFRREYLKCLKANVKARREYSQIASTNTTTYSQGASTKKSTETLSASHLLQGDSPRKERLDSYIDLVRQRQRHERLRVLQDFLNKLEQKSEGVTSFLGHTGPNEFTLPRIPTDVVTSSDVTLQNPTRLPLQNLVSELEKGVLRAKLRLKNEKYLLEQVKNCRSLQQQTSGDFESRGMATLQALGRTRDELITWIEGELGKSGESLPNVDDENPSSAIEENEKAIDDQLLAVKHQYARYIKARRGFLEVAADPVQINLVDTSAEIQQTHFEKDDVKENTPSAWIISPYLQDLLSTANEQKSLIQQKAHLTVSLAKQHKETVQAFDRLADESHLLPIFPLAAHKPSRRGLGQSGMDELEGKEMPNASHKARAWTHAAELASIATKETVLANTEDGEAAIARARHILSTVEEIIDQNHSVKAENTGSGNSHGDEDIWTSGINSQKRNIKKPSQPKSPTSASGDMWASLNGSLGVLKGEQED